MTCPSRGMDHHAEQTTVDEQIAEAIIESAEIQAEVDVERAEVQADAEAAHIEAGTERNADDNETRVEIAEIEAAAAVEIAETQAAAEVAQTEAIAEAIVDASIITESTASEGDPGAADGGADGDGVVPGDDAGTAQLVSVPPQIREEEDKPKPRGQRQTNAFHARRR